MILKTLAIVAWGVFIYCAIFSFIAKWSNIDQTDMRFLVENFGLMAATLASLLLALGLSAYAWPNRGRYGR